MKKHLFSKVLTLLMALTLLMGMATTSAMAETATGMTQTPTLDKYLVMDASANVPPTTFTYAVTAGTAVQASGDQPEIFAGIGTPTIADITFTADATTYNALQSGDSVKGDLTNKKYAKVTQTIDFGTISFTEPGIYRYVITESGTNDGVTNDTVSTRWMDVYVESDGTALSTTAVVSHNPDTNFSATGDSISPDAKNNGFTNVYDTADLTLSKSVTGNQGYRQQYFAFTVEIANAVAGTKYTVDLSNADANPTVNNVQQTNKATIEIPAGATTVTETYYLKNGQSVKIQGLTAATTYTISETVDPNEGYITKHVITKGTTAGSEVTNVATGTQTMTSDDSTVAYENYRNGVVPTGILLDIWPYILIVAVAAVALILLMGNKRKHATR